MKYINIAINAHGDNPSEVVRALEEVIKEFKAGSKGGLGACQTSVFSYAVTEEEYEHDED